MTPAHFIGASFAAALRRARHRRRGRSNERSARRRTRCMAPRFEVDPLWPKPLPNHWVLGQAIGLGIDAQDHVWIVHRDDLRRRDRRRRRDQNPPTASCCVQGAAGPRIRSGRQPRRPLGRARRRLRLAGVESRHHHRPQGQRLDRRQRRDRRAHPEVHAGPASSCCSSASRARARAATTPRTSAGRRRSSSTRRPTRPTSPTATATSASSSSTPTPASSSATGAPTATSPTTPTSAHYDPKRAADQAVPHAGALRRAVERRPGLRLRPAERSHPGLHARTARS